jgi:tRNA A37 N6-isopentenylltransferase MiaA
MVAKLSGAIARFAKRQETYFRYMEKKGLEIVKVPGAQMTGAMDLVAAYLEDNQYDI